MTNPAAPQTSDDPAPVNVLGTPCVEIDKASIIFGDDPKSAVPLLEKGASREEIAEETGQILGVADASLAVQEGEILVLMGLSGSGKSTLLRAINGLNPLTTGAIRVTTQKGTIAIDACSKKALRKLRGEGVAMVFQQFALLPWRSVRDNIGLGLELAGQSKAERKARIDEQLELVGLTDWADKQVNELSGGMQQRVGLARAFATGAPILLMDEPYSALDPLIRAHLQDELLELQRRLGCTIIFVSHDLDEAIKIGNRIAIMEGGRIIQVGTPQDIILKPADEYVADFVAHMNPLQVLRAREIMQPIADGHALSGAEAEGDGTGVMKVHADMSVRDLLKARLESRWPIHVTRGEQVIGIIGEEDLYRALIR
jgi:glycine betaine/proline transport system ATP-binding protein